MMSPDVINGLFEGIGGLCICLSIRKLHQDKQVKGVSWTNNAFFTSWGLWNLFFYPSLDQWASFAGACFIVAANATWLGQMAYWLWRERQAVQRDHRMKQLIASVSNPAAW